MKNNIKALDKVERVYYIELPDGKIQFNPDNGIEFIKAFMKDFIYKYCKKDFYSNPKIVFANKNFSKEVSEGAYLGLKNTIVIDPITVIERGYHRYYNKNFTEDTMNSVIEMNLVEILIHELNHSMEFKMYTDYKTNESKMKQAESENEFDAVPRFFRRHQKQLKKYLGYNPYLNMDKCIFSYDTLESVRNKLIHDGINMENHSDRTLAIGLINYYNASNARYKKASIITHFFKEILQHDTKTNRKQVKFVKDAVFKDGYTVTIAIPEAQNNVRSEDDENVFVFNKLDFISPTRYMRKAPKVAEYLAIYNFTYSIVKQTAVAVEVDDKNKEILITFTYLSYSNLWNAIQYK